MAKALRAFALLAGILFCSLLLCNPIHAASLSLSGGCTLNNAIASVNSASDTGGCVSTGAYGTNDTITLPSGTTTIAADLPNFTVPVVVVGGGKSASTVDLNGHIGFNADFSSSNSSQYDFTFRDFAITGGSPYAMYLRDPKSVTVHNVAESNSTAGVMLNGVTNTVTESSFNNNVSTVDPSGLIWSSGGFAGLAVLAHTTQSTDIPTIVVSNVEAGNNSAGDSGISTKTFDSYGAGNVSLMRINIDGTYIHDNQATVVSGLSINGDNPASPVDLDAQVSAVTVANNVVTVPSSDPQGQNVVSGITIGGKLSSGLTVTNVTVANNSANDTFDSRITIAGLVGALNVAGSPVKIVNSTIVYNSSNQNQDNFLTGAIVSSPPGTAFVFPLVTFDNNNTPTDILNGAIAQNSLIAGNSRNGHIASCAQLNKQVLGLSGIVDLSPVNQGGNVTDDLNCTGYLLAPTVLSTLGPLQDNGGPVPTIALLDGSPAIGAAGQVLGITTDARGIARPTDPDAGAYQHVLGASTNAPTGQSLPNTGDDELAYSIGAFSLVGVGLYIKLKSTVGTQ